jgi:hypothetical protein
MATFPTSTTITTFPTTRPLLAFSSSDHLCFLRPGALARLRDARLRRWSRAYRLPLPSSPELASASSSPPLPPTRYREGIVFVPYFTLAWRLHAPWCPQRKKLVAAKAVVLLAPAPPSLDLPIKAVIKFLNVPDMVAASH